MTVLAIKQRRLAVREMRVMPCALTWNGEVLPRGEFVTLTGRQLAARYPYRLYEYARAGDYIGLIKKNGAVVDFQISPHHNLLREPTWRSRVLDIVRITHIKHQGVARDE